MAEAQYFAVAGIYSPIVFIAKGKRKAELLVRAFNRIHRLMDNDNLYDFYQCEGIDKYFNTRKVKKNNIRFCWTYSKLEKSKILDVIYKETL